MKLKAASLKKVGDESATIAGGVLGAAASRGVAGLIPGGTVAKLGIAVLAAFGAASVTGTDTSSKLVKGVALGMALEQAGEVVMEVAQPAMAPMLSGDASTLKDFGKRALGLAGGYDYGYDYPQMEQAQAPMALGNPYVRGGVDGNGNGQSVLMFG